MQLAAVGRAHGKGTQRHPPLHQRPGDVALPGCFAAGQRRFGVAWLIADGQWHRAAGCFSLRQRRVGQRQRLGAGQGWAQFHPAGSHLGGRVDVQDRRAQRLHQGPRGFRRHAADGQQQREVGAVEPAGAAALDAVGVGLQ